MQAIVQTSILIIKRLKTSPTDDHRKIANEFLISFY